MRPRLSSILETIHSTARSANPGWSRQQWLIGAAWFFLAFSLVRLVWVIAATASDPTQTVAMLGGEAFSPLLLTYAGGLGAIWAWAQAIVLVAAVGLTFGPFRKFRRIGHGLLLGWAGLWLGNHLLYAGGTGGVGPIVQAALMSGLFAATGYRAWMSGWSRRKPIAKSAVSVTRHVSNAVEDDAGPEGADTSEQPHTTRALLARLGSSLAATSSTVREKFATYRAKRQARSNRATHASPATGPA